jgi:DNA excision repair protein ERCC-5
MLTLTLPQALRNQQKAKTLGAADRLHKNLLSALVKHSAISKVLSEKAKAALSESHSPPKKPKTDDDDLYVLPPSQPLDSTLSSSEDESSADDSRPSYDLHSINTESAEFKSLPVDVRHEILSDLKDTRKQSSWGRIHELPTENDDFSVYQMNRLLKRQSVQVALEEVEKEMGGHSLSLGELETLLKDQGVITNLKGSRIASDENTRFLLIKDIKQAVEEAKKQNLAAIEEGEESDESMEKMKNKGDIEYEDDLKKAIAMSLEEAPSTSKASEEEASSSSKSVKKIGGKGKKRMSLSFLENFEDADFGESESSEEETIQIRLTPAQRYMMEYSGLTPNEIAKIIASKNGASKKANIEEAKIGKPVVQPAESTSDASRTADSGQETVTGSGIEEVNVSELIRIEEQEDRVTTSSSREVEEGKDECFELKSDSESNDSDDFLDVEDSNVEQVKKNVTSMEVVIKPDEELEDDLFKDIFDNEDQAEVASEVSSTQDKVIESIKQFVSSSREEESKKVKENIKKVVDTEADSPAVESIVVSDRKEECLNEASSSAIENLEVSNDKESSSAVEEVKSTSQTVKDKIEKLIKDYSRPKEAEPDSSKLSVDQLNEMRENLRKEEAELATEKSTKERHAGSITDQMYQEAQVS